MKMFDILGALGVAQFLRRRANQEWTWEGRDTFLDAADDIQSRHSNDQAYSVLRVALRNALFRVTKSDPAFDPSPLFRMIEEGHVGVGYVTDTLEAKLKRLQDEAWADGVEGTCKRVYGLSQADTDRTVGLLSEAG